MKIAVVIEHIDTRRGGAETSAAEFIRLLAGHGHEVHVISAGQASLPGVTVHALPITTPIHPLRTAAFIQKAGAFVQSRTFDIVHAIAPLPIADVYQPRGGSVRETLNQNIAMRTSPIGRLAKRIAISLDMKQHSLLRFERQICRPDGPLIAAVSQYVADQFARHYDLHAPRVQVVFNGIDFQPANESTRMADRIAIREELRIAPDEMMLLCVAHNFRLKGVDRLIESIAKLHRSGVRKLKTVIVGRDEPAPFQRQAARLGVADHLIFTGPSGRVAAYLHATDCCVHATNYDPCSRIVLEALSSGISTITTRQNGASEVISDGINGFVIQDAHATDELAARISQLCDAGVRRKIGAAAAELAPRLTMSRHVLEMLALYKIIPTRKYRGIP